MRWWPTCFCVELSKWQNHTQQPAAQSWTPRSDLSIYVSVIDYIILKCVLIGFVCYLGIIYFQCECLKWMLTSWALMKVSIPENPLWYSVLVSLFFIFKLKFDFFSHFLDILGLWREVPHARAALALLSSSVAFVFLHSTGKLIENASFSSAA